MTAVLYLYALEMYRQKGCEEAMAVRLARRYAQRFAGCVT